MSSENKALAPPTSPSAINNGTKSQFQYPPKKLLTLIVAGLMTGMLLGAMDQTIVATAGPTIIADLSGLSVYAWVFSAYILTQTVSMPVFGKLSDLYGRRKIFMLGLGIFMVGSILSGAAQNIDQLIIFRAIQGIGSGAFFPVAIAVVGVVFPPQQRGRIQGIFASVFGIAAVIGPSVGSYLVQAISWRWIFYINLPLGVVSIILISLGLKESRDLNAKSIIDWLGISTLTGWIVLLMLGFLNGGSNYPWLSWQEGLFFGGATVLFPVFLYLETKAKEPVIPLRLFRIRTISSASVVAFLRGIAFFAVISFVPLFVQGALGGTIDDARNVLYSFMFPLIAGTLIGGQLAVRTGYRKIILAGIAFMSLGIFLMTYLTSLSSLTQIMEYVAVMGFGVGITFPTLVLAIQFSVEKKEIGIASSLAQFMGNLGGTIGLSILGTIQINAFSAKLNSILQGIPEPFRDQAAPFLGNPNLVGRILSTPQALAQLLAAHPEVKTFIPMLQNAFAQSMVPLFLAGFFVSIMALVASLFMKGSFKQQVAVREARDASDQRPEEKEQTVPAFEG